MTRKYQASSTVLRKPLSPLCPRCGSHRTRVVGSVKGSSLRHVLCLSCNKTSQLVEQDAE